jgi:hypothetical protein
MDGFVSSPGTSVSHLVRLMFLPEALVALANVVGGMRIGMEVALPGLGVGSKGLQSPRAVKGPPV